MLGAVAHNIGQLLTAFFLVRTAGVLAYLPILLISGIITGLFTGPVSYTHLDVYKRQYNKQ